MKRMLILVVITMLTGLLFAEEGVLIDFTKLNADIYVQVSENDTSDEPNQNRHTMMDFSNVAGGSFTPDQRAFMKTSLAIQNWDVELSSSARTVETVGLSFTREAKSTQYESEGMVMGVRVRFPTEPFNVWATVKPPFEIPAFDQQSVGEDGTIDRQGGVDNRYSRFEAQDDEGPAYGVIKNVGVIKSVAVTVYGLNFPHGLSVMLIDSQGNQRNIFMGYLEFDGWGELVWNNPQYVSEVRNRDIRLYPLYPTTTPFVKFGGFLIQRDAAKIGGDFITYFKDVRIVYDLAVLSGDRDIDDESTWNIINDRENARKAWEMERFGQAQVLRYLELQKQAREENFDHYSRRDEQP